MTEYASTPVDSWRPINLAALDDRPVELPTLAGGLAYPGKRHLWTGEPESGKSWAALIACALEILNERAVVYIDFETDDREIRDRLRCLNVSDYELEHYFLYLRPTDPIGAEGVRDHMDELIAVRAPSIVVVDAYAGALDLHELDPNSGADIEKLNRTFFEPLRAAGAATIVLDHLAKNKESRGRFAIGSERKLGIVDVHLGFEIAAGKPFGRGRTGLVKIRTHKDRPGFLARPRVADLELSSSEETGEVKYELKSPHPVDADHPFRPTALMEKVSRWLEDRLEPVSRNSIETDAGISAKRDYVRQAIDVLVLEGFLEETEGPKRGLHPTRMYRSLRPYREALDEKAAA